MLGFDTEKMLYTIPPEKHSKKDLAEILGDHPEIQYVSLVGIDMGGHDTDEKIPVALFLEDTEKILAHGAQTDGSSVALPGIASLGNAKVDIIPDLTVNWYVDYNLSNLCRTKHGLLPVGTLRIPSFLVHNESLECGSRALLRRAIAFFKSQVLEILRENPYLFDHISGCSSVDEIEELVITSATELEFWVKTPDDKGDREQLFTAQVLKEQYWKRTYGEVRTALEDTLYLLDKYGFGIEMGHKEVGGVKAKMGQAGHYDHVMEQLEIDWKYADAMQAADNENQVKYIVRDIFTKHGLDVTFMAKPFDGVAGSGEHTHIGLAAKLKNGKMTSLFAPADMKKEFMSPLGFGALMGLLKNYEVVNPFISKSNDSLNRLKPGFEAPVCIVTSLGKSVDQPSRNRTVLVGLIRDTANPLSTRFELRAPNPKSDTYLVLATSFMAIVDGMLAVVAAGKTPAELEKSLSKKYGEEDFYLERDREYRSEEDVFDFYTQKEREKLFGRAPATVWENMQAFDLYPEKMKIFERTFPMDAVMPGRMSDDGTIGTPVKKGEPVVLPGIIDSYRTQVLSQWKTELHDRLIPETMDFVRGCKKLHTDEDYSDYDVRNWIAIDRIRQEIAKTSLNGKSLLAQAKEALDEGRYADAADLQLRIKARVADLRNRYEEYKKNLL